MSAAVTRAPSFAACMDRSPVPGPISRKLLSEVTPSTTLSNRNESSLGLYTSGNTSISMDASSFTCGRRCRTGLKVLLGEDNHWVTCARPRLEGCHGYLGSHNPYRDSR